VNPHHLGFAAADLEAAMAEVGALLGVAWREPVIGRRDHFRSHGTRVEWLVSHVKSTGENGLTVELLQGEPGSTWYVPAGVVFHHYAYAPADRTHQLEACLADGWAVDVCRDVDDPRESTFVYLTKAGRTRIELCQP
jgi:hypothetical protein